MGKTSARRRNATTAGKDELMKEPIVIDEPRGLIFSTEDELYDHFLPQIQALEKEFFTFRSDEDVPEKDFEAYEGLLAKTLDDPDEIWEDAQTLHGFHVRAFVSRFDGEGGDEGEALYYVALAYCADDVPTFVFLHFPSTDFSLVERFRRGELLFDRVIKEVEPGALEGDALTEGDDLAVGLYKAMLKVRSDRDVPEEKFQSQAEMREPTIEEPDEIWRTNDLSGNILVSFIKDFSEGADGELWYIVVTIEDTPSSSHALLFSFPTRDRNLVDRYRHGENLQAEEVVQEASH